MKVKGMIIYSLLTYIVPIAMFPVVTYINSVLCRGLWVSYVCLGISNTYFAAAYLISDESEYWVRTIFVGLNTILGFNGIKVASEMVYGGRIPYWIAHLMQYAITPWAIFAIVILYSIWVIIAFDGYIRRDEVFGITQVSLTDISH